MLARLARWFDDWYAIQDIAQGITAIGEPRFHQVNWSYLLTGTRRALLFDTGTGVRDIAKLVRELTTLPVTALPSHLHFDHTGGLHRFTSIAMGDLAILRECERNGRLHASDDLFLGHEEGMVWTPVKVTEWLAMGSTMDLGGRRWEIVPAPGHSPDSVALLDHGNGILLAADFIYPGPLYAQVPGADLADYLASAHFLLEITDGTTRVLCAHGNPNHPDGHQAPELTRNDIADLAASLERLAESPESPGTWPVNESMRLLISHDAYRRWRN